jgi:hypothetical protein
MTFRRVISLTVLALALLTAAWAAGATGKWTATFNTQVGEQKYTWDLTAAGSKLTGIGALQPSLVSQSGLRPHQ